MSSLKVALVGRPNVGKSALFNRIIRKRIAIVDEQEGITRDRLYQQAEHYGQYFTLIDTGGMDAYSKKIFSKEIIEQAHIAVEEADILILVVDAKIGVTSLDKEVCQFLQKTQKKLILAVNKVDTEKQEESLYEYYSLGIEHIIPVSAEHGRNIDELLDAALDNEKANEDEELDNSIKVALVGRANVGKSTLLNYLLNDRRSLVSPIPGTTRDSIDCKFVYNEKDYTLIDTAGIRRKYVETEVVDKFAAIRTERAIERCDVCFLVLDVREGMTTQDKRIASMIEESGKSCIILFNKWDLVSGHRKEHCLKALYDEVPFFKHCPMFFVSAKEGRGLDHLFDTAEEVLEQRQKRITTGQLNNFISKCMHKYHPPMIQGKRLRIYYLTQRKNDYPSFIFFINYKNLLTLPYKRYLINQFREEFGFSGTPIQFIVREKIKKDA
ncbi:MAG TPA: ribosome biogenesis GTPase Der [Chlamydiales bacterium]|nr:ribosome biogenesis GTPase Der [Chlamydiales bacterium]